MRLDREEVRAIIGMLLGLLIFLFGWAAANLHWYGQWVRLD